MTMKVKNVHLPHPHPKGGFSDPLLEGGMLCIGALVVKLSEVHSTHRLEPV